MPLNQETCSVEGQSNVKTILVVEDDEAISELITLVLSQETPYKPLAAVNASEALCLAACSKVDLFVIDYYLPGMNGLELYDTLHSREELQSVPALILTASLEKHEQELQERNVLGLKKPFELDELLLMIKKALASP
jgi:CheY-like chemotaxis protein